MPQSGICDPFASLTETSGKPVLKYYHSIWMTVTVLYINLNTKTIALGMPGIKLFEPIGNHAITIKEFKFIYVIYKKYEGKQVLEF